MAHHRAPRQGHALPQSAPGLRVRSARDGDQGPPACRPTEGDCCPAIRAAAIGSPPPPDGRGREDLAEPSISPNSSRRETDRLPGGGASGRTTACGNYGEAEETTGAGAKRCPSEKICRFPAARAASAGTALNPSWRSPPFGWSGGPAAPAGHAVPQQPPGEDPPARRARAENGWYVICGPRSDDPLQRAPMSDTVGRRKRGEPCSLVFRES